MSATDSKHRLLVRLPIGDRMTYLLRAAEDALGEYQAPLTHGWLVQHEVTLDEAYDLSDHIKAALKVYRSVPVHNVGMALVETELRDAEATS